MNLFIWMMAGAALGWAAFSYLNLSEGRGMAASLVVGATGGILGGKFIAPMFAAAAAVGAPPNTDFSVAALFFALIVAAMLLFVGNFIHSRWGV